MIWVCEDISKVVCIFVETGPFARVYLDFKCILEVLVVIIIATGMLKLKVENIFENGSNSFFLSSALLLLSNDCTNVDPCSPRLSLTFGINFTRWIWNFWLQMKNLSIHMMI